MKKLLMVMSYLMTIMMMLNFSSFFLFWMSMEMNTIMFTFIINNSLMKNQKKVYKNESLYYFCIQTMSSMAMMMMFMNKNQIYSSELLMLMIMFKMGMYPFMNWYLKLCNNLYNNYSLIMLISIQKLAMFLILFSFFNYFMLVLILMNLIYSVFMMFKESSMIMFMTFSSIYSSAWFMIMHTISMEIYMIFMLIYTVHINVFFEMILMMKKLKMKMTNLMITTVFFMGMPPLSFFYVKMILLNNDMMTMTMKLFMVMFIFIPSSMYFMKFFPMIIINMKLMKLKFPMNISKSLKIIVLMCLTILTMF